MYYCGLIASPLVVYEKKFFREDISVLFSAYHARALWAKDFRSRH